MARSHKISSFSLFLLLILIFFLIFSSVKVEKRKKALYQQIDELQKKLELLKQQEKILKGLEEEGKDSFYAEKILREKGLYKKKGEKVAVILGRAPELEKKEIFSSSKSFWQKIIQSFK